MPQRASATPYEQTVTKKCSEKEGIPIYQTIQVPMQHIYLSLSNHNEWGTSSAPQSKRAT